MTVSGILVLTTPQRMPDLLRAIAALEWAEAHDRDESGRLIVTIEAESSDEGSERLKALKRLPGVLAAEMVIHCFEEEATAGLPPAQDAAAALNAEGEGPPRRSHYSRLKARSNF